MAVPGGVGAPFAPAVAPVTSGPLVLGLLGGIFLCDGGGIVAERKSAYHANSTPTNPSSTAVVSNEFSCQLQPEGLDRPEWYTATVALLENVGVGDSDVEQKIKNILIKFSALRSATIVAANLVTPVNSAHELIVIDDGQWTRNSYPCTILLPTEYSARFWLSGGRHDCHNLPVHPGAGADITLLDGEGVTSTLCI